MMQANVAGLRRNIKNIACNYTEAQIKVREATSNDPWGPSVVMLSEIADLTYNVVEFPKIMEMIWRRLNDTGKNWRHVKKALILMEYLVKAGVEKCVKQCKENIFAIEALTRFVYYEDGKDYGRQVREKSQQLVNLLRDNELLRSERNKVLKAKERFARYSSGFGYNDEIPIANANSDLESVRPKTYDEEEMQIKLALDISREEAQLEQLKRRSDDVRLRLAMEQSERDFHEQQTRQEKETKPQSHLLDFLDISLGAAGSSRDTNLDPWNPTSLTTNIHSNVSEPWPQTSIKNPQLDPWQPTSVVSTTNTNNFDTRTLETSSSTRPSPPHYGWLESNFDNNNTAWPTVTTIMHKPVSECTNNAAHCSNQSFLNSVPITKSFPPAQNCNKDDYVVNLGNSTTTAESSTESHNPYYSSSNPFL